jgi:hypothetical protein
MTEQDNTSTETTDETVKAQDVRNGKIIIATVAALAAGTVGLLIARKRKAQNQDETAAVVLVEEKPAA